MSVFKCKMCGGTLEIAENQTVAVCEYCGTKQTLPKLDDEKRANLYDRANHFRRNNEFDKAMSIYENILNEESTDCEAYWSLVLCRYGIEYVEDPTTKKRVPTVNRAQFTSIFDDDNYKSTIDNADVSQKQIYEDEAKAINEIQKGILAISQNEEPFDVFICYKETDMGGRRTPDSVLANELYHQLTNEGFKVFYSRITLEDKLGQEYEPYIFAALNSAKVMVVLATKPEYFNAVWVKNEWSRYLGLVKASGGNKILIPAFRDMDPYDLPEEFSHLQAQDMSKLGFVNEIIRGIKKLFADKNNVNITINQPKKEQDNTSQLIDRAFIFIETGDRKKADVCIEKVLNVDAKSSDAYLAKCLIDLKYKTKANLEKTTVRLEKNKNFILAYRFANPAQKQNLQSIIKVNKDNIKAKKLKIKKRNKRIVIVFASLCLAVAIGIGGFFVYNGVLVPAQKYKKANSLAKNGNYSESIKIYNEITNYKDVEKRIFEANYQQGLIYYNDKKYEEAISSLKKAKGYNLQNEKLNMIEYEYASKLYSDNKFEESAKHFLNVKTYKDAEIKYLYASAYSSFFKNNFYEAYDFFKKLKSKGENLEDVKEYHFCVGNNAESISEAKKGFMKCGNYDLAKKALNNLNIIERIQGSWHVANPADYLCEYTKVSIMGFYVTYETKYNYYTGTKVHNQKYKIRSYYPGSIGHFGAESNYSNVRNTENIVLLPIIEEGSYNTLITDENLIHYATNSMLEVLGDSFVR